MSEKIISSVEKYNPEGYRKVALKRPKIRKLGTILCDMVETTPIVFNNELYRFESVRPSNTNESNNTGSSYFHFVNVRTNQTTKPLAFNYHFGCAYADGGYMYVVGTKGLQEPSRLQTSNILTIFRSCDLDNFEEFSEIVFPQDINTFNTGICKKDGVYTMLIEVTKPIMFHFRFAQSTDMKNWTLLEENCSFHDRYTGGPAIYTIEGDPYYYVLYLEAYPGPCYMNCIARSKDLSHWEYSPINPILMFDDEEDKKIGSHFLTEHDRERIERAVNVNNSDLELCEFNGRTIMYYSWGSQTGIEFLSEAVYEGKMKDFLQGFFQK